MPLQLLYPETDTESNRTNIDILYNELDAVKSDIENLLAGEEDTQWIISNVTDLKTFDADTASVSEIRDVLGTLLNMLLRKGVITQ